MKWLLRGFELSVSPCEIIFYLSGREKQEYMEAYTVVLKGEKSLS